MSEGWEQSQEFRSVMGRFPTGVTVVAAVRETGTPFGLTVNSFTSVSLDPPLVLVCVNRGAASHDGLLAAPSFCVSVLAEEQVALASRFASDPSETRFDDVAWEPCPQGAPRVLGAVAWLECTRHEAYTVGDHTIMVGRVASLGEGEGASLVFHRGTFGSAGT